MYSFGRRGLDLTTFAGFFSWLRANLPPHLPKKKTTANTTHKTWSTVGKHADQPTSCGGGLETAAIALKHVAPLSFLVAVEDLQLGLPLRSRQTTWSVKWKATGWGEARDTGWCGRRCLIICVSQKDGPGLQTSSACNTKQQCVFSAWFLYLFPFLQNLKQRQTHHTTPQTVHLTRRTHTHSTHCFFRFFQLVSTHTHTDFCPYSERESEKIRSDQGLNGLVASSRIFLHRSHTTNLYAYFSPETHQTNIVFHR